MIRAVRWCMLAAVVVPCACGDHAAPALNVTFDGARALEYAKAQVDAGPRIPGTLVATQVGDWIVTNLKQFADTVVEQKWTYTTAKGEKLPLRNIIARFNPKATRRILYMSHWDSKPTADQSFSDADKKKPMPGANDGASSTALLMAVAENLKREPTTVGVDLLFTDAEDYGTFTPDIDVLVGAKYFADHLPDPSYKPAFGVLFDMIGDNDLRILREATSQQRAPEVNDRVWKMAASLGYSNIFVPDLTTIGDDHIPLLDKGLKVVDVIDLQYGPNNSYWHTTQDTMDKISAHSLEVVGRVAMGLIRQFETEK